MRVAQDKRMPASAVTCPNCGTVIPLEKQDRLPDQFSVPCPKCGSRKIFSRSDIHDAKDEILDVSANARLSWRSP